MTIEEILQKPDAEILRVGLFVKQIVRAWHDITNLQPDACDCQLKGYLRTVRRFYSKDKLQMDKFYFDGRYFQLSTITQQEKDYICKTNKTFYDNISIKYGWVTPEVISQPQIKINESNTRRSSSKKRSKIR
jgi:hypothetical protein